MEDTIGSGERADVSGEPLGLLEVEHAQRYLWAQRQVSGRVLDVACGTGYGSAMLARRAQVSGLDRHPGAVAMARRRAPDVEFAECELPPIPFADQTFDAVVTFETVEHIAEDRAYVAEIRRVLKPGGMLLLSTPNAAVTSPDGAPSNPWHVREYTLEGLRELLADFAGVEVFMQRPWRRDRAGQTALRIVSRFPLLRHPQRLWDRLAFGSGEVESWDGRVPWYWVIRAHR